MSNEVKEGSYGEPWRISPSMTRYTSEFSLSGNSEWAIYENGGKRVCVIDCDGARHIKLTSSRVVSCVNALSGIADPIGFVRAVEEVQKFSQWIKKETDGELWMALERLQASRTNNQNSKENSD